ncbi:MAG: hypothetical protein ACXV8U_23005 [Methylobacter sp.]
MKLYEGTNKDGELAYLEVPNTFLSRKGGKRRLNFATLTTKERLHFQAAKRYRVDIITHVNL